MCCVQRQYRALFKASGRSAFAGRLTGFILGGTGVLIGLILLAKGPPEPESQLYVPRIPSMALTSRVAHPAV